MMIWIFPALVVAWTFATLGAQAVWLTVLLAAARMLMALLLVGTLVVGTRYLLRRHRERNRQC